MMIRTGYVGRVSRLHTSALDIFAVGVGVGVGVDVGVVVVVFIFFCFLSIANTTGSLSLLYIQRFDMYVYRVPCRKNGQRR